MTDALIEIGAFLPAEADALGVIFYRAVHEGAAGAYDASQRHAWASKAPTGPDWAARLTAQHTFVARDAGRPVGFMTLDAEGHIDLAFVDPDHQRRGLGGRLYNRVETVARETGLVRLSSEASHLARGLFERRGWQVLREQRIERAGVMLTNFAMEKRLTDAGQD